MPSKKRSPSWISRNSTSLLIILLCLAGLAIIYIGGRYNHWAATQVSQERYIPPDWPDQHASALSWAEREKQLTSVCASPFSSSLLTQQRDAWAQCGTNAINNDPDAFMEACEADTGVPESDKDWIVSYCVESREDDIFAQIECAAIELDAHYNLTDQDECCRDYANSMARIIPRLSACQANITATIHSFSTCRVFGELSGHVVNKITVCPTQGPNKGKCFTYMYEPLWDGQQDIFYPADTFTINWHKNKRLKYYHLPQICGSPSSTPAR